ISSKENVTLIIYQEISSANAEQVNSQGQANAPPATIRKTRTTTRVHLPTDHFLILSGMIQEEKDITREMIPCLGSLPLVGPLFGSARNVEGKRNLMLFLRPHIIDSEVDIDDITKKQEDIIRTKSKTMLKQRTIVDDAKELLNL